MTNVENRQSNETGVLGAMMLGLPQDESVKDWPSEKPKPPARTKASRDTMVTLMSAQLSAGYTDAREIYRLASTLTEMLDSPPGDK